MKKLIVILILTMTTQFAYALSYLTDVKSGVIEYRVSGIVTGWETRTFKDYNKKSKQISELKIGKQTMKVYIINDGTKVITKMAENQQTATIAQFDSQYDSLQRSLKKIGESTILGKKCDIYETHITGQKMVIHRWKKFPLKSIVHTPNGIVMMEATKIDLKDVSDSEFVIK